MKVDKTNSGLETKGVLCQHLSAGKTWCVFTTDSTLYHTSQEWSSAGSIRHIPEKKNLLQLVFKFYLTLYVYRFREIGFVCGCTEKRCCL